MLSKGVPMKTERLRFRTEPSFSEFGRDSADFSDGKCNIFVDKNGPRQRRRKFNEL